MKACLISSITSVIARMKRLNKRLRRNARLNLTPDLAEKKKLARMIRTPRARKKLPRPLLKELRAAKMPFLMAPSAR
jgi:hypothetical protein